VYGLGDLSTILDERAAQQTEALLGHLRPVLSVYVPTQPHVEAVRSLAKHGLVLLLGDPGTGKSTIAAILATVAADKRERQCFRADGPEDFIARWNPNEPGFFWIDDAFGPNQLRDDYVDRWLNIFPKVQAALAKQSQFVLTSRRHIYYAAEVKLGSRTLPWFRDKQAVVNVGALTKNERHQVLYNHIKAGVQSWQWKSNIKPHLSLLAEDANLIPEIARRLADPAYTRQLDISASSLVRFVREPKAHLLQTIREMSKEHRAALTLVFLHNGQMTVGTDQSQIRELVMRHFGIDHESLGQAIPQLRDSFLFQRQQNGQLTWAFKHPTIADAVSAFLGETDGLVELYLRGTRPEVILSEVVCSGVGSIPDSTVVPESLNALLADIVLRIPDEPSLNERLFSFLWTRASDRFFQSVVTEHPELLARKTQSDRRLGVDSRINVHSRAAKFGVLPDGLRYETTARLTVALLDYLDTTFLADNDILGIIPPTELMLLLVRLRSALPKSIQEAVQHVIDEIDYEVEPDEHFYELRNDLDALNIALFGSEEPDDEPLADELRELIDEGVKEVLRRQEEREQEGREDDWDWRNNEPKRLQEIRNVGTPNSPKGSRSVFSDVDE
jgi:energy-coupling factor transporter ATP-binding protein EcfA2